MGATIEVTPARLADVHTQLATITDDLRCAVAATGADVAGLLGGGWTGLAADAFGEAWSQWRAGAAQVIDALEVTSALLLTGSQAYHEQENHTRAAFATMAAS